MSLNFTNDEYFALALRLAEHNENMNYHTIPEAFHQLISDLKYEQLDNLCECIKLHIPEKSLQDIYLMTQEDDKNSYELVYSCANECLSRHRNLGNETLSNGRTNASSWLSHSLWEGRLCAFFAGKMGLDRERAEVMGMLHDYGRKEVHSFLHAVRGFEMLTDCGFEGEAIGCLTHSFLNGGRCANNEKAEEGFYVSADGAPCWKDGFEKDQITLFLEKYNYTWYDKILNISDLMAATGGILSPYDRIIDIASRRTIDPVNRGYFIAEFIGTLALVSEKMNLGCSFEKYSSIRFDESYTIDSVTELFKEVSDEFYSGILAVSDNLAEI